MIRSLKKDNSEIKSVILHKTDDQFLHRSTRTSSDWGLGRLLFWWMKLVSIWNDMLHVDILQQIPIFHPVCARIVIIPIEVNDTCTCMYKLHVQEEVLIMK